MKELVFWHGWGMSPDVWTELTTALQDVIPDTVCIAVPLPGYANTPFPEDNILSSWVENLLENVSGPITLCGWSMGAILSLSAAERYPEKIERLILFGATPCFGQRLNWPHGMSQKSMQDFRQGVISDAKATLRRFVSLFNRQDKHARTIVRQLSKLKIPPVPVLLAGLDFLKTADFRSIVPNIKQKTLLIQGENDPLMPPDAARWLAENMPNVKLTLLPDTAHAPFLSDPAHCANLIGTFLGH